MAKKKPIADMDDQELIFTLLADKIGSVDPKDVFYAKVIESGKSAGKYSCTLAGKKLTPNQLANLQNEARILSEMQLWKVLTQTLSHEAELRMFKLAKTTDDLMWGKAILHAVSVFESIVRSIQNPLLEDTLSPPANGG